MRVLWVVQRYGDKVLGGAESEAREIATHLATRGHEIEVLTSCATDHVTWANVYEAGTHEDNGVLVHRLAADRARSPEFFTLDAVIRAGRPLSRRDHRRWLLAQGPVLPELPSWLAGHTRRYDVTVFMTYLYYPTVVGLPIAAGLGPTVLVPTAHDEPALHLPLFDTLFHHADRLFYNSEEEAELLARRLGCRRVGDVIGNGVDLDRGADEATFRAAAGIGDDPYLLYVGRIDEHKGVGSLLAWFRAYKIRHPSPLRLVLVGRPTMAIPGDDDIVLTGFVEPAIKDAALAGALALVQLSPNESFSIVLVEAWAQSTPAIVAASSPVLRGQGERSGAGLPVGGFAEFEAAVELLQHDEALRASLGATGRRYVERTYAWPVITEKVEACLAGAIDAHGSSLAVHAAKPRS